MKKVRRKKSKKLKELFTRYGSIKKKKRIETSFTQSNVLKKESCTQANVDLNTKPFELNFEEIEKDKNENEDHQIYWRKVKDKKTNDEWFYNIKTKQIQWEKPSVLETKGIITKRHLDELSVLSEDIVSLFEEPKKEKRLFTTSSAPESILNLEKINSFLNVDPVLDFFHEEEKIEDKKKEDIPFFLPDGSSTIKLREKVNQVLNQGFQPRRRKRKILSPIQTKRKQNNKQKQFPSVRISVNSITLNQPIIKQDINSKGCFLCWCAGEDQIKRCEVHYQEKKNIEKESLLVCTNWKMNTLMRKYRSEERIEIFNQKENTVKFDPKKKNFIESVEYGHIIYRLTKEGIDKKCFRIKCRLKFTSWVYSVLEEIRMKKIKTKDGFKQGKMLSLRKTLRNRKLIQDLKFQTKELEPEIGKTEIVKVDEGKGKSIKLGYIEKEGKKEKFVRGILFDSKEMEVYDRNLFLKKIDWNEIEFPDGSIISKISEREFSFKETSDEEQKYKFIGKFSSIKKCSHLQRFSIKVLLETKIKPLYDYYLCGETTLYSSKKFKENTKERLLKFINNFLNEVKPLYLCTSTIKYMKYISISSEKIISPYIQSYILDIKKTYSTINFTPTTSALTKPKPITLPSKIVHAAKNYPFFPCTTEKPTPSDLWSLFSNMDEKKGSLKVFNARKFSLRIKLVEGLGRRKWDVNIIEDIKKEKEKEEERMKWEKEYGGKVVELQTSTKKKWYFDVEKKKAKWKKPVVHEVKEEKKELLEKVEKIENVEQAVEEKEQECIIEPEILEKISNALDNMFKRKGESGNILKFGVGLGLGLGISQKDISPVKKKIEEKIKVDTEENIKPIDKKQDSENIFEKKETPDEEDDELKEIFSSIEYEYEETNTIPNFNIFTHPPICIPNLVEKIKAPSLVELTQETLNTLNSISSTTEFLTETLIPKTSSSLEKISTWCKGRNNLDIILLNNIQEVDEIISGVSKIGKSFTQVYGEKKEDTYIEDLDYIFSLARHGKVDELDKFLDIYSDKLLSDVDNLEKGKRYLHIDSKDGTGNSLLIIGAQNNSKKIIKLCLRRGCDINIQNSQGNTALHYAKSYKFEELFEYLLKKGADDGIINNEGLTCYEGLRLEDLL
eukprot:snap_masked-scaffold_10-processed-gene-5.25-mRNA-1 protein AED:0.44 eAED:0.48 QI:0/0/0/0.5/1/1/2/0/1122